MKNDFDYKQIKIIKAWYTKAEEAKKQKDWYSAFISLWISFNAFCYGKYEKDANKIRVDIDKYTDIFNEQEEVIIKGIAEKKSSKNIIKIDEPWKLIFSIKERYTEEIIFRNFSIEYQELYEELLKDIKFKDYIQILQESLKKKNRFYVINMSRLNEYYDMLEDMKTIEELNKRNIVVLFEDIFNLQILKNVLYQIRCNIFHGEKTPGDINDDRIVSTSFPVLKYLLEKIVIEKL